MQNFWRVRVEMGALHKRGELDPFRPEAATCPPRAALTVAAITFLESESLERPRIAHNRTPSLGIAESCMYERVERPLNAVEIRMLRSRIEKARRDSRISVQLRQLLGLTPPIVIVATLFSWFVGRSPAIGALSGAAFVAIMAPLVVLQNRRTRDRTITGHSNALAIDRAIVHSVQAHYCVRFEEREDEGDLWMFQVGADDLLALQGQIYYENTRFPALKFEVVEVPSLPVIIRAQSAKVSPSETVCAPGSGFLPSIEGIGIRALKGDARDWRQALQSLRG